MNQSDKDTTPPDHTDLSELREQVLKTGTVKKGMVTFSQKMFSNNTAGPVAVQSQDVVEIGIDDLMQLFKQYAQPPVVADKELDKILGRVRLDSSKGYTKVGLKQALLQREQRLVAAALKTERTATLGLSNPSKIDRALFLAEKAGYEKALKDIERRKHLSAQLRHNTNTGKDE